MIYLIRGLPGSGKSTLARYLSANWVEADMFFVANGVYTFDKEKLTEAHAWCQNRFRNWLKDLIQPIAVSNTFVRRWELMPYYSMVEEARKTNPTLKFPITEITLSSAMPNEQLAARCIHSVPVESIARMRALWEM